MNKRECCLNLLMATFFCSLLSCKSKPALQKISVENTAELTTFYEQPPWIGTFLDLSAFDHLDTGHFQRQNIEAEQHLTVLYYFRGDCSSCIVRFIEWRSKWNSDTLNTREVDLKLVSRTSDVDLLMHYLRVAKVELKNNLYLDGKDLIAQSNDIIGESDLYTQIFLIDNDGKALAYGDPLSFQNVREIYSKSLIQ